MNDWTIDPATGRSNSSPEYLYLVDEVSRLIRDSAHSLISGETKSVARTIMSQLAHVHGLHPCSTLQQPSPGSPTSSEDHKVGALPQSPHPRRRP